MDFGDSATGHDFRASRCSSRSLSNSSVQLDGCLAYCVEGPLFTFSFPRANFLIFLYVIVHCARRKVMSELILRESRFPVPKSHALHAAIDGTQESSRVEHFHFGRCIIHRRHISVPMALEFQGSTSAPRTNSLALIKPNCSSHERSNIHFPKRRGLSHQSHVFQSSLAPVASVVPFLLRKLFCKCCIACNALVTSSYVPCNLRCYAWKNSLSRQERLGYASRLPVYGNVQLRSKDPPGELPSDIEITTAQNFPKHRKGIL